MFVFVDSSSDILTCPVHISSYIMQTYIFRSKNPTKENIKLHTDWLICKEQNTEPN